jgi:hypothetical protein
MTVDIRATVFSNLGEIISGDIATEYAQGSGLVKTRGSVEVVGIRTPKIGDIVDLGYEKDGRIARFFTRLRVLSSFADPYKNKTIVQIGCILTLKDGAQPKPEDPNTKEENNTTPCKVFKKVNLPISASFVASKCLLALGIAGNVSMLKQKFSVEKFDLSPGYIQVLSDLLISESYLGFINEREQLEVISLASSSERGPLVTADNFITFGPLGFGDIPADNIIVRYSYLKLKLPDSSEEGAGGGSSSFSGGVSSTWERSRSGGPARTVSITAVNQDTGLPVTASISYSPVQSSSTSYDSKNRPRMRVTVSTISSFEMNSAYCTACLNIGRPPPSFISNTFSVTEYSYIGGGGGSTGFSLFAPSPKYEAIPVPIDGEDPDPEGTGEECIIEENNGFSFSSGGTKVSAFVQTTEYHLPFMLFGASGVDYYVPGAPNDGLINISSLLGGGNNIARTTNSISITEGQYSRTITTKNSAYCYTEQGQQGSARAMEAARQSEPASAVQIILDILKDSTTLVWDGSDESTRKDGGSIIETRPSQSERNNLNNTINDRNPDTGVPLESTENIEWISGQTNNGTIREFRLPYASDDEIQWSPFPSPDGTYTKTASIAPSIAKQFGTTQNALLFGNRNGISITVAPGVLPEKPFSPFYVNGDGVIGQFRTNGLAWAFDSNGIVVQNEALYYGGVSDGASP